MANSDAGGPRRVRCPRCHSVLEEPSAPVYQCGGCGVSLRAKNRAGDTRDVASASSPSRSGLPPQSRHSVSTDVASTSTSTPDATSSRGQGTGTASRRATGDLVAARGHGSGDVASTSSTPEASSSRAQGIDTASRRATGDLVSARGRGSGDVASTSSTPEASSSRQQDAGTPSRRMTRDPVSVRTRHSGDVASTSSTPEASSSRRQGTDTASRRGTGDLVSVRKSSSGDVASSSSTPDTTIGRRQGIDTTSRREPGDPEMARSHVSEQVQLIEKMVHDRSTNQEVHDNSEAHKRRDAGDAECIASSPGVGVHVSKASKAATSEFQDDAEKRRIGGQAELPEASTMKDSGEAEQSRPRDRAETAPASHQVADSQSAHDVLRREDDTAAAAGAKARSPPRHELQSETLAPLRKKILKTVDELKDDLSELFSKSPELNPTTRARPPRRPKQEGIASRAAMASELRTRARHTAATADVDHRGGGARVDKPGKVAAAAPLRGLPSRRYRRCRADPCCDNLQPRSCRHGCCGHHHGKPAECTSCRGNCCRPRAQEPSPPRRPPAASKRRPAPRHHCRPVLKGAPFIVCSSCFTLVQVPADLAVSTRAVRKLRCGSCSAVLSYSYRDPARKKLQDSMDRLSTDGSEAHGGPPPPRDPFAFLDDFGHGVSYSTEDEQPLHVSRNTSFGSSVGETNAVVGRLHRLMGYGSASELLRRSPDLYESFDERPAPGAGQYDRKGKGVCLDADDFVDDDDSDDEGGGAVKRSAGMIGKGTPGSGAIRIKS
ncbi:hypothetical protein ACP70R_005133 [Stipagrostis hirtigluma subsp. patula]